MNRSIKAAFVVIALLTIAPASAQQARIGFDQLPEVGEDTITGRTAAGTGDQVPLTPTQVRDILNISEGATPDQPISKSLIIPIGDETTNTTVGTSKRSFQMPYALTLTAVRASCVTAPVGSTAIFDIKEAGTTVLSTLISIDANETSSFTAAVAPVISDTALADDAIITFDVTQIGSTTASAGCKAILTGTL